MLRKEGIKANKLKPRQQPSSSSSSSLFMKTTLRSMAGRLAGRQRSIEFLICHASCYQNNIISIGNTIIIIYNYIAVSQIGNGMAWKTGSGVNGMYIHTYVCMIFSKTFKVFIFIYTLSLHALRLPSQRVVSTAMEFLQDFFIFLWNKSIFTIWLTIRKITHGLTSDAIQFILKNLFCCCENIALQFSRKTKTNLTLQMFGWFVLSSLFILWGILLQKNKNI